MFKCEDYKISNRTIGTHWVHTKDQDPRSEIEEERERKKEKIYVLVCPSSTHYNWLYCEAPRRFVETGPGNEHKLWR